MRRAYEEYNCTTDLNNNKTMMKLYHNFALKVFEPSNASLITRLHTLSASAYTCRHAPSQACILDKPFPVAEATARCTAVHACISFADHPGTDSSPFRLARPNSPYASRAIFCERIRESPSANLQHCRKSVCSNPVPDIRVYDPTSCFRR